MHSRIQDDMKSISDSRSVVCGSLLYGNMAGLESDIASDTNPELNSIKIEVDGKVIETAFANEIDIKNEFKILKSDFRVNIIGYSKTGVDSEDDILINEKEILDAYSIDTKKRKYRAEFYKDGKFYGMIVLNFLKD